MPEAEIEPPAEIAAADWEALWKHGGFPEPFLRRDSRFTRRWRSLRREQLAREDLRDASQVRDLRMVETLMLLLADRSGQQLVYSNLAQERVENV
jgi:predicted AAA+ superfamily ATPase